jgi:hypothetical protein
MGGGTREAQYKDRFGLGGSIDTFGTRCLGLDSPKRLQIGEYIIKFGNEGYDLRKGDQRLGIYKEAKLLLSDRALFKLEKGMLLEITPRKTRKILSPAKAGILGFINSDGSLIYNTKTYTYRIEFGSISDELTGKFDELMNEVYGISMHKFPKKDKEHFIYSQKHSKDICQDLNEYTTKASKKGKWNVPFEYLDKESATMFLKCFMSGDGGIGIYQSSDHYRKLPLRVRFYSTNRKGLEEIATLLRQYFDLDSTINREKEEFSLNVETRAGKIKYIKEIGSFKQRHIRAKERALKVMELLD